MPTPDPSGPSRRTLVALLVLYLLSIGTSITFLSRSIGTLHVPLSQSTPTAISDTPVSSQGKHPAVVYFSNEMAGIINNVSVLRIYNVSTGQKIQVLRLENTYINEAQVSPDGQWILFLAGREGPYQLERIRINGQQQEILYKFPPANYGNLMSVFPLSAEWSLDQKSILIATDRDNATSTMSVLDVKTRHIRTILQITSNEYGYYMVKWLDRTHIYIIAGGRYHGQNPVPPQQLYLLDITARQALRASDLKLLLPGVQGVSFDFDSSPDGKRLFVVQGTPGAVTIWVEPAIGGKRRILSHSVGTPFKVDTLRVFTSYLLLTVTFGYEHHEVWEMPLAASRHIVLFRSTDYTVYVLNRMTRYIQSNVSGNETMFAFETYNRDLGYPALFVSPLHEGRATKFDTFSNLTGSSFIVGWTTI